MVRIHPDPPGCSAARSSARNERGNARRTDVYLDVNEGPEQRSIVKFIGAVAQLGERLLCKQEVVGSIPSSSTIKIYLLVAHCTAFSSGLLPGVQS